MAETKLRCSVAECQRPPASRGWCVMHYSRWRTHGDPLKVGRSGVPARDPFERFMSKVDLRRQFTVTTGHSMTAGRWLLGHLRGEPLRPDEWALHHCDNPPCVNPGHLYVGDHAQNMRDMKKRARHPSGRLTHCAHDHKFTPENTYVWNGSRSCRTCGRAKVRRYQARRVS